MAASLSGVYSTQQFTDAGLPASGYRLYTYSYGTTTLKTAYTDAAGSVAQTYTSDGIGGSYIALNARGELPAPLYLTTGSYDLCLKTPAGATVWTRRADPISDASATVSADLASTASGNGASLIGFLAAGAAAIGRTLLAKLLDWPSITDNGAVADGNYATGTGTDNLAAIQAFVNQLSVSGGGVAWVPGGIFGQANSCFKLSGQLVIPDGVTLRGAGKWSSIFFCPTTFANTGGLIRIAGSNGYPTTLNAIGVVAQTGGCTGNGIVSVKNGVFISDAWVNGFNVGVTLSQTDNFLSDFAIEDCTFGISVTQTDVNIQHGTIYACTQGASVGNSAAAGSGFVNFQSVRASQCPQSAFVVSGGKQVKISDCSASADTNAAMTVAAVLIDTSSKVTVSDFNGNIKGTASTTSIGIKMIGGSTDVTIDGPQLFGFLDGINSSGCDVSVTGGQSRTNGRNGALFAGGSRVKCTGLDASGNGLAGTGSGIDSQNSASNGIHTLVANTATQSGGGTQQYGIKADLTDNLSNTGVTIVGSNVALLNSTANINCSGKVANIVLQANVPDGGTGGSLETTITAATYSVGLGEKSLIANFAGTVTLTLPAASSSPGRSIDLKTITANTVVSASANVAPLVGGAAGTAILAATAGKFCRLTSDGTSWQIMQAG